VKKEKNIEKCTQPVHVSAPSQIDIRKKIMIIFRVGELICLSILYKDVLISNYIYICIVIEYS